MKILLANKFYYRRGGDCIVTMNLEKLLNEHGHDTAIYSMNYPENLPSKWSSYWAPDMKPLDALTRPFGSRQVKEGFSRLLDDFRPEIVHLHNIHTQLSPVIAEIASQRGIPVVWTLHDTKPVCPCYTCMRNGEWCEECFTDTKAVVRHRCMPGSLPGAVIGWRELLKWNKEKLQSITNLFLPPSQFLKDVMVRGGYAAEKMEVLSNFIDTAKCEGVRYDNKEGDSYVYVGRVNRDKGVHTLCEAASQMPGHLTVIGDGELLPELRERYAGSSNITFKGKMEWNDFRPLLEQARFMVVPSEWSENNPLTIIESLATGTPVLGARIGGIPELITEGVNGMTFTSGDVADLKEKIALMQQAEFDYPAIAREAAERYSAESYYERLMKIYRGLLTAQPHAGGC